MTNREEQSPTWGARLLSNGSVRFRLWAPAHPHIQVVIEGEQDALRMRSIADGWHELMTPRAHAGSRYRFRLPDGSVVPDPASRFQPDDVMGPSEVIDHRAYAWRDTQWQGRPWHTAVIYELHVGAFTPSGTFLAIIERLPQLAKLGVTAIELMPIGDFPGRYNWGYDGVLPYAPDSSYGRPDSLKALVDAAHEHGLMVMLDVVYNHFGPEGNFLASYAPQFFTDRHHTPWGAAINFDGDGARAVRDFFIENALYWLDEFHLDGLRLDAVHHLIDDSETHILTELAHTVRARFRDREIHLILENESNEASRLERGAGGSPGEYTAQWNDDVHHVLHVAASGEGHGYYGDYLHDDARLSRALAEGFAFQGDIMKCRGSARGEPSAHLPPAAFIAFLQNHDQVGNRAFGERLQAIAPVEAVRAASAVYLLLPQIPMLFMGEEWNSADPFIFFCDFKDELAMAIREGRRKEFAAFPAFREGSGGKQVPDPDDPATFARSRLNWDAAQKPESRAWRDRYRWLLEIRHREIVPRIPLIGPHAARAERLGPSAVQVTWSVGPSEELVLVANLSASPGPKVASAGRLIWQEGTWSASDRLEAWTVLWGIRSL